MKKLIFEFNPPLGAITVVAHRINEQNFIKLFGFGTLAGAYYTGFECSKADLNKVTKFFNKHNIKFRNPLYNESMKHVYCKLEKPLERVLFDKLCQTSLKLVEYCQIEGKVFLEAFKCTEGEFFLVKKAFDEVEIGYSVY